MRAQSGKPRVSSIFSIAPTVFAAAGFASGSWIGANATYAPEAHKITCDMSPAAELRTNLEEVGVEVLGVRESGAFIGLVTDSATGTTDGIITAGDDIVIEGDKIKVAPDDEAGLGVFFVAADGTENVVVHRLMQNDPKKVVARVPALAAGAYTLIIKTRFSSSSALVNQPRTVIYSQPLIVAV